MSSFSPIKSVTDDTILNPEHEDFDPVRRIDQFKIANVEYVRSESLAGLKEPRTRISSIWRFDEKLICTTDEKEVYYCYSCERQKKKQLLPKLSGNTGAHQHLLRQHNINGEGHARTHAPTGQHTISDNAFILVSVAKKSEFQRLLDTYAPNGPTHHLDRPPFFLA